MSASLASHWISRERHGKGFSYRNAQGQLIQAAGRLKYYRSLVIPPAWREVRISSDDQAKVLATGIDSQGRHQAIYHPKFRAEQDKAKFERILAFAERLPAMRRQIEHDLLRRKLSKDKVLACIIKLMDAAYFRVGNDNYARDHHTYGITTLRSKHAAITTTSVTFDFVGKSGKQQHKVIGDRQLARLIKQLDELPGYEIFRYVGDDNAMHDIHAADVNAYIKLHMAEEFTAKDFRTWGGTLLASAELAKLGRPATPKERSKAVTQCVKSVAKALGNTPAVCRDSYIDPRVINAYIDTDDLSRVRDTVAAMRPKKYMSRDEQCVLELLKQYM